MTRCFFLLLFISLAIPCPLWAATYQATNSNNHGAGSLRQAILDANANPGTDTVVCVAPGPITILSSLPALTERALLEGRGCTVTANGQGFTMVTLAAGSDGSTVCGFALIDGLRGVDIVNSHGNRLYGCAIGVDWAGATSCGHYDGVRVNGSGNAIGGSSPAERNVISGNTNAGILLENNLGTVIAGNYLGVNPAGNQAVPNLRGIEISSGTVAARIGGLRQAGQNFANVISGNRSSGITNFGGQVTIQGNIIGLDASGSAEIPNRGRGIDAFNAGGGKIVIGGDSFEKGNIISGNDDWGIYFSNCHGQTITGNSIGLSLDGLAGRPNYGGIQMNDCRANLLLNNRWTGTIHVMPETSAGNTITGNTIGFLANGGAYFIGVEGVRMEGRNNWVGLPGTGQGNLIGHTLRGVAVYGDHAYGNGIFGNTIVASTWAAISLDDGYTAGNHNYPAPVIVSAEAVSGIAGTANPGDYIEVFIAERAAGQGGSLRFLGSATAGAGGAWSLAPGGYATWDYVCATATDSDRNTSEFSSNRQVAGPTPTVTHTPTVSPTLTMTGTSTPTPTMTSTATHSPTATATPSITATPSVTATSTASPTLTVSLTATVTTTRTATMTITPTLTATPVRAPGDGSILAFPNPAQHAVRFRVSLEQAAEVRIALYNAAAERVGQLAASCPEGANELVWECGAAAPGVYFARVLVNSGRRKLIKLSVVK